MPEITEPVPLPQAAQRERAARALFAATEMVANNKFETDFGRSLPQTRYYEYLSRYRTQFVTQVNQLSAAVGRAYVENGGDLAKASGPALRDAWGSNLKFEHTAWNPANVYLVRSAGLDKRFNTPDDLTTYVEVRASKIVGRPSTGPSTIQVKLEHDRGPYNGRAAISGTVVDQRGGAVEGATVTIRGAAQTRTAHVDADGKFSLAAVPAGTYHAEASMGSESVAKELALAVRDSAVLSVVLRSAREGTIVVAAPAGSVPAPTFGDARSAFMNRADAVEVMAGAPPIWGAPAE